MTHEPETTPELDEWREMNEESQLWPKPAFDAYRVALGEGTYRKLPYPHDA